MSRAFLLDEHVPRLLETTLRSNGYPADRADDVFEEGARDEALLGWCHENDRTLPTNDRTDFARLGRELDHNGVFVYVDPLWVRDRPNEVVHVIDVVSSHYSTDDLRNEVVWLDEWRTR